MPRSGPSAATLTLFPARGARLCPAGAGGGWALLGGHRIDLSGLTAGEARALVLAAGGAPGQEGVDAALRKVLAALPAPLRDQVVEARRSTAPAGAAVPMPSAASRTTGPPSSSVGCARVWIAVCR